MMTPRELADALHDGRRVYGTCVLSPSPLWPDMVVHAGADFVFIDTEHIPIDRNQLSWMCALFNALGAPPIVRIPAPQAHLACMALDSGAAGIVAPYMETVEQVDELRGAVKLGPLKGRLLRDALRDPSTLPEQTASFIKQRNTGRLLLINIESIPALEALDNLLAVPGLDALLLGPHDLSVNLGVPEQFDHPLFLDAIKMVITRAREVGVGVGVHYSWGIDRQIEWAQMGANLIIHANDLVLARQALSNDFARFRQVLDGCVKGPDTSPGVIV